MDDTNKGQSLSRAQKGFTVAASPLNGVKVDLAVVIVLGILLLITHGLLSESTLVQLAILLGYGLTAMAWIVLKTRRLMSKLAVVDSDSGVSG